MHERRNYHIVAVKRDGRRIEGTMTWDGLAAIVPVTTDDGKVEYVSALDEWLICEEIGKATT